MRVVQISKAYLAFGKVAPILAYAAEYMSVLIIWHRVWIAPLLVGRVSSLLPFIDELVGEGKCPPDWLRARYSKR